MSRVESHIYEQVYVAVGLEMIAFHEEGGDGGMMGYLFHIKGDPSNGPLQSFPQDRIKRFADLWIARQQKDKG